jgi:hypothetical protein
MQRVDSVLVGYTFAFQGGNNQSTQDECTKQLNDGPDILLCFSGLCCQPITYQTSSFYLQEMSHISRTGNNTDTGKYWRALL